MTVFVTCDYCGEPMGDDSEGWATIEAKGDFPDRGHDGRSRYYSFMIGQYHTGDEDGACYWRVSEAIRLAQDAGGSLERIPTISGQAVAARRRKHRPAES